MKNDGEILLQSLLWQNPWISLTPGPKFSCGRTGHSNYASHLAWMQNSISSRELSYCFLPRSLGHLKTKYVNKGMRSQGTCVEQNWRLWGCSGTGGFLLQLLLIYECDGHGDALGQEQYLQMQVLICLISQSMEHETIKGHSRVPWSPAEVPRHVPGRGTAQGRAMTALGRQHSMAHGGVLRTGGRKEKPDLHHLLLKHLSFAKILQLSAAATPQCRFCFLDGTKDPADNKICLGSSASIQNHSKNGTVWDLHWTRTLVLLPKDTEAWHILCHR